MKANKKPKNQSEADFEGVLGENSVKVSMLPNGMPDVVQSSVMPQTQIQDETGLKKQEPISGHVDQSSQQKNLRLSLAEQAPTTLKAASSLNTAPALAGLNPWSKDWVFVGDEEKNPTLKTLIPEKIKTLTQKGEQSSKLSKNLEDLEAVQNILQNLRSEPGDVSSKDLLVALKGAQEKIDSDDTAEAKNLLVNYLNKMNGEVTQEGGGVDIERAASGLNGQVKSISGEDKVRTQTPQALVKHLTGSEFANTLNSVGKQSKEQGQGFGQDRDMSQNEPRSRLKVLEGGNQDSKGLEYPLKLKNINSKLETLAPVTHSVENSLENMTANLMDNTVRTQVVKTVPSEVAGHVVPGEMARERLTRETLLGMSNEIQNIAQKGTGGEMRVRLKPDGLGELNLHVMTRGQAVGLKIQASNEQAKKILEESIGFLKETLANQNLSLAKVDVSVTQATNSSPNNQFGNETNLNQWTGQNSSHRDQARSAWDGTESHSVPRSRQNILSNMTSSNANSPGIQRSVESGRLDVMA